MLIDLAEKNSNIKLIFCHNHTKIIGIKSKEGNYIIEGSGNLTGNARIEQYMIEKSTEIYNFHQKWIKEISRYGNSTNIITHNLD